MRYSLRKQEKIKAKLGEDFLKYIIKSLNEYFSYDKDPNDDINPIVGEIYPTLMINDIESESRMIAFYIISKKYDVYNLAFKDLMKC